MDEHPLESKQRKVLPVRLRNAPPSIDNLSANGKEWSYRNLDSRHWFHQIGLPNRYKRYMAFNRRYGTPFIPTACPMDWFLSPRIGQSITWSLVLGRKGWFPQLFGLPDQAVLQAYDSPFPWIPLNCGGGIFVLLDNILIVTASAARRDAWFEHIVNNCNACTRS